MGAYADADTGNAIVVFAIIALFMEVQLVLLLIAGCCNRLLAESMQHTASIGTEGLLREGFNEIVSIGLSSVITPILAVAFSLIFLVYLGYTAYGFVGGLVCSFPVLSCCL